jgi:hypothetical protein
MSAPCSSSGIGCSRCPWRVRIARRLGSEVLDDTTEVGGKFAAQLFVPERITVVPDLVRGSRQNHSQRRGPGPAGERAVLGAAGAEVVAGTGSAHCRRSALTTILAGQRYVGDDRAGRWPRGDPPLGGELRVGIDDGAARQPEVGGQAPAGGQTGPCRERSVANRVAQRLRDSGATAADWWDPQQKIEARLDHHEAIQLVLSISPVSAYSRVHVDQHPHHRRAAAGSRHGHT